MSGVFGSLFTCFLTSVCCTLYCGLRAVVFWSLNWYQCGANPGWHFLFLYQICTILMSSLSFGLWGGTLFLSVSSCHSNVGFVPGPVLWTWEWNYRNLHIVYYVLLQERRPSQGTELKVHYVWTHWLKQRKGFAHQPVPHLTARPNPEQKEVSGSWQRSVLSCICIAQGRKWHLLYKCKSTLLLNVRLPTCPNSRSVGLLSPPCYCAKWLYKELLLVHLDQFTDIATIQVKHTQGTFMCRLTDWFCSKMSYILPRSNLLLGSGLPLPPAPVEMWVVHHLPSMPGNARLVVPCLVGSDCQNHQHTLAVASCTHFQVEKKYLSALCSAFVLESLLQPRWSMCQQCTFFWSILLCPGTS